MANGKQLRDERIKNIVKLNLLSGAVKARCIVFECFKSVELVGTRESIGKFCISFAIKCVA